MKVLKKSILFLLIALFTLEPLAVFAEDNSTGPAYSSNPSIILQDVDSPKGYAGSEVDINVKLQCLNETAYNVVIKPELSGENSPFEFTSGSYTDVIPSIRRNDYANGKIKLFIKQDARDGVYPLDLNITYTNRRGDYVGKMKETVYVRVLNLGSSTKLLINKVVTDPESISPGGTGNMRIFLENKGSSTTKNIEVSLEGLNSAEGFYVSKGSNKAFIDRINGESDSFVDFEIAASRGIKSGGHGIDVKLTYPGPNGAPVEDIQKIYLNVGKKGTNGSNLNIEKLSFPTAPIKPGADYVLSFDLVNKGGLNANNLIVKAESTDPKAVVPKSQSIRKIDSIEAGKSQKLDFVFTPTKDAETMNYPISITIEYEDELNQGTENKYVLNQYVGIYVNNPKKEENDDAKKSKPKLIINNYNFSPNLVRAGENFTMNLSFYNTNAKKSVKNIKIFLTSDEKTDPQSPTSGSNVFTPVESSNTFFIDNIPPKGVVEKTITMFTVPDAKAKTYTLTANFEYEDSEANEFTATELIGVPVVQKSKLDVGQLNLQDELYSQEGAPISLEFYNTGKVTLYNLMVRLEGNFGKESASYYVGNFDTGASDNFDATLIPNEEGELKGEIVFTYEDSSGESIEHREPFTRTVGAAPDWEGIDDLTPPEETGGIKKILTNKWVWLAVIVLAVGGRKFYKKRKDKKEYEENLDDSDDVDNNDTIIIDDKGSDSNE